MNVFLLDNEKSARETIKAYLDKSSLQDYTLAEASSIQEAITVLKKFQPDLAILDINLDEGTCFDLLGQLDHIDFKIIFVSAYDQYAIKAFRFNALDYVLKPINPPEFFEAINKSVNSPFAQHEQLQGFSETIVEKKFDKIVLRDSQAIHFIKIDELIHCRSESNYTAFITEHEELVISKTIGEYENLLREKGFFRSHRSHLINLHQIKRFDKRDGGSIQMSNDELVPLARNKKDVFMKLIDQMK
ncbi:MAG: LytTR family DNA-binding domain-containing protein [Cytophagales bacterium]|nr:LytTR family DNA-binding domain-containing protein [Cytophagales bacterium]